MSAKVISAKVVAKPRNTRKPWAVRYWADDGHQREVSHRTQREAADAKDRMLAQARHRKQPCRSARPSSYG
jgi:hypothetical protein